jgi:hypothetical protein
MELHLANKGGERGEGEREGESATERTRSQKRESDREKNERERKEGTERERERARERAHAQPESVKATEKEWRERERKTNARTSVRAHTKLSTHRSVLDDIIRDFKIGISFGPTVQVLQKKQVGQRCVTQLDRSLHKNQPSLPPFSSPFSLSLTCSLAHSRSLFSPVHQSSRTTRTKAPAAPGQSLAPPIGRC